MMGEFDTSTAAVEVLTERLNLLVSYDFSLFDAALIDAVQMLRALRAERDAERQRADAAEAEVARLRAIVEALGPDAN